MLGQFRGLAAAVPEMFKYFKSQKPSAANLMCLENLGGARPGPKGHGRCKGCRGYCCGTLSESGKLGQENLFEFCEGIVKEQGIKFKEQKRKKLAEGGCACVLKV